jgi:cytochrome c556
MRSLTLGIALACTACIGTALAQGSVIKQRQDIMDKYGKAMGVVGGMAKGETYNAKAAADAFTVIKDTSVKFATLFPAGTETGENTRAKPEIWKNKKDFDDWAKHLEEDAVKAVAATAGGLDSMKTALAAMGKTCGGCHDDYRAPEKK